MFYGIDKSIKCAMHYIQPNEYDFKFEIVLEKVHNMGQSVYHQQIPRDRNRGGLL